MKRSQNRVAYSRWLGVILALGLKFLLAGTSVLADEANSEGTSLLKTAQAKFSPLPADMATPARPIKAEQVNLGRHLFFEPRVSVDGTVSCSRCHLPALYGADGLPRSHGALTNVLKRNAPTVFNAALQFKAHWDGVNDDVEMQAHRALTGPGFANPDAANALKKLKEIDGYRELFEKAFPDAKELVTLDQWSTAIGAYERILVSPSRFDDYLRGSATALTATERQGLRKFIEVGCADCHLGANLGGTKFEKFGVASDYWMATKSKEIDKGRFDLTHAKDDLYVFKVPSLRNVEMTPPYFHDGSVDDLRSVVRIMSQVQLGQNVNDQDLESIIAFLKSLTGPIPATFREAPLLPAAGFQSSSDRDAK